jgi:EpsI family protein
MRKTLAQFICAALMITATAIFLRAHTKAEYYPSRIALQQFPMQVGEWSGTDLTLSKDTLDVLGPGDFLLREYQNPSEQMATINLFIAYFRSQRAGDTIHSPKNCLPGSGWAPVRSERITLSVAGHAPFEANRYIIARGGSRQIVLYWYWAHDRGVASEYWAKYYLVKDSIKMNRSDGSLVRVITQIRSGETADAAEQRLMPFVSEVVPQLNNYIPR